MTARPAGEAAAVADGPRPPATMDELRPVPEAASPEAAPPPATAAATDVMTPESLAAIASVAGTAIAGVYASIGHATECPDVWRLDSAQREQLDKLSGVLVMKYLPMLSTQHPELWAFALFNVVLIGDRVARTVVERKRRALAEPRDFGPGVEAAASPPAPVVPPPGGQIIP